MASTIIPEEFDVRIAEHPSKWGISNNTDIIKTDVGFELDLGF